MHILPVSFYLRTDVTAVARDLLGKLLVTDIGGRCAARIVETEAYAGVCDRASHAFGGRKTERTRVMYEAGGVAYVYLCYGIHHLFNVVTHEKGVPHAVLIRAAEPLEGVRLMSDRMGGKAEVRRLCSGPGRLSRAMGITTSLSGVSLRDGCVFIAGDGFVVPSDKVLETPRIGVDYAGEDAKLRYRYIIAGHPGLSGRRNDNAGG